MILPHTESKATTCVSGAICADCEQPYGSPNPVNHNLSEWQPNLFYPNLHYRYCKNSGCGKYESEPHDGNSNCVTSDTCSKCHTIYTDTTKHAGPFTYTYEKEDENFHKKVETCTACGKRTGSFVSTKHDESAPANCTYAAFCAVCESNYGGINPDNHGWSNWIYENENQHYRFCGHNESHIQHADHRGYATCIYSMPCLDCEQSYNDPDSHEGEATTTYVKTSRPSTRQRSPMLTASIRLTENPQTTRKPPPRPAPLRPTAGSARATTAALTRTTMWVRPRPSM